MPASKQDSSTESTSSSSDSASRSAQSFELCIRTLHEAWSDAPQIDVSFSELNVRVPEQAASSSSALQPDAEVINAESSTWPTVSSTLADIIRWPVSLYKLFSPRPTIQPAYRHVLQVGSGIIRAKRMTLILAPPGAGQ
jgi:hypothetical protein